MTAGNDNPPDSKKNEWLKGKKRLLAKDANAPKVPLSGYMLFAGDQRELLRQSNENVPFVELNRIVSQKWSQLEPLEKQKYLDTAEADKERYLQELEEYKKTDSYKEFIKKYQGKEKTKGKIGKKKKFKKPLPLPVPEEKDDTSVESTNLDSEVPIFTEPFLKHNKLREAELRQLRRSNTEYEEQNAVLQKHIESMKSAINRLQNELDVQKQNKETFMNHIDSMRKLCSSSFASVPLPESQETSSEDNIESYLLQLHSLVVNSPQQHQKLVQNVKNIVNELPLN